ncbi:hypothetical protein [Nonomuraea wenchangensis]|uniref:Uncharacterized protein n=1 Tax=Nonomuraea wenchangensis TaxID=568860 RepID=A0A1I0LTW5_9ACTN|nr:hypothetical protein [Nonomuraea wenchangensis]SEU46735.1 hypothetical protein SAMN05421811_127133 [Nonomuraea wenchangensis]
MLILPFADIPGNTHHVSEDNPAYVTHADQYRMSWATIIERSHPNWDALTEGFVEEYRPTDTFGVAGAESQEHSLIWLGPADVIARLQANPVDVPWSEFNQHGIWADRWPNGDAWNALIPRTTWNPDGQGVVTEYPFEDGNGSVVVYEMLGRPALLSPGVSESPEGPTPLVTWHCTRCHEEGDSRDRFMSAAPSDRRTVCMKARKHMRPGQCRAEEANARGDRMVAVVQEVFGRPVTGNTAGLYAAQCATKDLDPNGIMMTSSCAEVSEARTHTDRHRVAIGGGS